MRCQPSRLLVEVYTKSGGEVVILDALEQSSSICNTERVFAALHIIEAVLSRTSVRTFSGTCRSIVEDTSAHHDYSKIQHRWHSFWVQMRFLKELQLELEINQSYGRCAIPPVLVAPPSNLTC